MSNAMRFALTVMIACLLVAGPVILVAGCGLSAGQMAVAAVAAGVAVAAGDKKAMVSILLPLGLEHGPPSPPLEWAKRAGGTSYDYAADIAVFPDNSFIITGDLSDSAVFGAGDGNETTLVSAGYCDLYTAKYHSNGALSWAKILCSSNSGLIYSRSISTFPDSSFALVGYFQNSAIFGEGELNETVLGSGTGSEVFVASYNPDGTLAWAKNATGLYFYDSEYGISAFPDGSVVVAGSFYYTATFGAGEVNETLLTSAGNYDIFIAKYNFDGTLSWAKSGGGNNSYYGWGDYCYDISALPDGSSVVTGNFYNTTVFGEGETNETALTSAGHMDIFIAKYNPDGTLSWAKSAGGNGSDCGLSTSAFPDGSVAVAGEVSGKRVIFGAGEENETIPIYEGDYDVFIAKYNPDGTLAWAQRAGGAYDNYTISCGGISALPDGSAIVTGYFDHWFSCGRCTWGRGEFGSVDESLDIFIAKYNPDGKFAWAKKAGGANDDYCYGISTLLDGSAIVTGHFYGTTVFGAEEENETWLGSAGYYDIFIAKFNP